MTMFNIIESGLIESDDHLKEFALRYGTIIIPSEDDIDLTHWWLLKDDGTEMLYLGTPVTFTNYIREQNGGIQ